MKTLFIAILLAVALLGCVRESDYLHAPSSACTYEYTGQSRDETITTMQCFGYDSNGFCNNNVPITSTSTSKEVHYVCDWKEWK